jgi:hypothetical protein
MDLASKLQLKPGQRVVLLGESSGAKLGLEATRDIDDAHGLVVFVADRSALEKSRRSIVAAATDDKLVWVAYPKAGQLGTDLNRDQLAKALAIDALRPVRQIAIDDLWSALRFRFGGKRAAGDP